MAKSKIDFRHIVIEAILIVFTVSLALALSEWRSNLRENRTRETVLSNIIKELVANEKELEEKIIYHEEMSAKIKRYLNSDSLWSTLKYNSAIEAILQIMDQGFQNPNLQSGAWRSAELSGVVNSFDYRTIYILSNIYRVQEEGPESTWKEMVSLLGNPIFYDPEEARTLGLMLQLGFQELHAQEASLIVSYQNATAALEKGD